MTPFGAHIRELRAKRGVTLKQMADELEVSSAYLSALEHGKRGQPSIMLVRQICAYFQIFWDEAEALERLAEMSHPRIVVDTSGLTPKRPWSPTCWRTASARWMRRRSTGCWMC